jgi:hypothetical protein
MKMYISDIFFYLTRAFECVNHELLLFELACYGVQGGILDWNKYYLYNRKMRVEVKSSKTQKFCSS